MPEAAGKITLAQPLDVQEDATSTALASSQEDSDGDSQKASPQKMIWADVSDSDGEAHAGDAQTPADRNEVQDDGWTAVGCRTKPKQPGARPMVSEAKRPGRDAYQKRTVAQQDTTTWRKERPHQGWHESSVGTSRSQATEHQNKSTNRSNGSNAQEHQRIEAGYRADWQEHRRQPKPRADDRQQKEHQNSSASASKSQASQGNSSHHVRRGDWQEQRKRSEKPGSTDDWLSKRMGAAAA